MPTELPNKLPTMHDIQLTTSLLMIHNYFENQLFHEIGKSSEV